MMMKDLQLNNPWLADRAREIRAGVAELRAEVEPLAYLQLGWQPSEGGWSIAQVIEHLIVTDASYIESMETLLAHPPQRSSYESWRPSLIGGFLVRSQMPDSKQKLRTPSRWRPGPQPRADGLTEYIELRERLIDLVTRADGHDLRRTRLSSPASKLIRLNLGDAIMTLVVHTQRHLKQIQRIKAHPGFPAAA
jgi:hypothetical protein